MYQPWFRTETVSIMMFFFGAETTPKHYHTPLAPIRGAAREHQPYSLEARPGVYTTCNKNTILNRGAVFQSETVKLHYHKSSARSWHDGLLFIRIPRCVASGLTWSRTDGGSAFFVRDVFCNEVVHIGIHVDVQNLTCY